MRLCISITHFPEEETEAQRGENICLKSHKELSSETGLECMTLSDSLASIGSIAQNLGGSSEPPLFPYGTKVLPVRNLKLAAVFFHERSFNLLGWCRPGSNCG